MNGVIEGLMKRTFRHAICEEGVEYPRKRISYPINEAEDPINIPKIRFNLNTNPLDPFSSIKWRQ